ncbi:hypothetical protein Taro_056495 [Colocasia esculenta]|uniref:Uncharacterized protein n=1 Tax=Colocasia esculenta TaxID=4460 RepID=A0A843XWL3_COLES|nr:hypothetical protein [Colocasia esculenta]
MPGFPVLHSWLVTSETPQYVKIRRRHKHPVVDINVDGTLCKRPTEAQTPHCERNCKRHVV